MLIVDEPLLDRFRHTWKCEWCSWPTPTGCDPAHVHSRGAGRLDIPENALALCRNCHDRSHAGYPGRLLLLVVVGHRECMLIADIEELIWQLRRLPKERSIYAEARAGSRVRRAVRVDQDADRQGVVLPPPPPARRWRQSDMAGDEGGGDGTF